MPTVYAWARWTCPHCFRALRLQGLGSWAFNPVARCIAGSYEELVGAGRRAILQSLQRGGVGDLGPHILHESVIDPPEWRARYGLEHGAAFGMDHGLDQLAVFRPAVKDARIRGLYFAGASTRPGNGVPLVLIGSRLTAERVIEDRRQQGAP